MSIYSIPVDKENSRRIKKIFDAMDMVKKLSEVGKKRKKKWWKKIIY